jgi:hypothetical protein
MSIMLGTLHFLTVFCISMAFVMAIGSVAVAACEGPLDLPNPNDYDSKIYVFMFVFSFYTIFLSLLQTAIPQTHQDVLLLEVGALPRGDDIFCECVNGRGELRQS